MSGDPQLRAMLYDLTENSLFETTFNMRWAAIGRFKAHSIRDTTGPGQWNFNCFAYALRLNGISQFDQLVAAHGQHAEPLVPARFVKHLKTRGILIPCIGQGYTRDDIVLYYDGKSLEHAARVASPNTLISKWGVGRIYEHGVFEVPDAYGDTIEVVRTPDVATTLSELGYWHANGRK